MLNHKFKVHRLMEDFGFEAGNQEKEINHRRGSISVLGRPLPGPGITRQAGNQLGEDSFPTASDISEAGRDSSLPAAFDRGQAGRHN